MAGHHCCLRSAEKAELATKVSSCPPRRAVNVLEFFMGTPEISTNLRYTFLLTAFVINM